jgi:hypothetical protein
MRKIHIIALTMAIASLPLPAQRLAGCSESPDEARDRALRSAGHHLSRDSESSVKSPAALKLTALREKESITILTSAWSATQDSCTKFNLANALGELLRKHWVAKPESTIRIAPFQSCTPSSPAAVSLRVEQLTPQPWWTYQGPTVRMIVRNLTSQTLPFLRGALAELFSVTVLDPNGQRAKIPAAQACYYKKCDPKSDPTIFEACTACGPPFFSPLPPHSEDDSWIWQVGQDFDMSAPGVYSVSLGAKLDFLDATVCSNIANVTVK